MTVDHAAGVSIASGKVLPEWIDINGHMNVAYYVLAFDLDDETPVLGDRPAVLREPDEPMKAFSGLLHIEAEAVSAGGSHFAREAVVALERRRALSYRLRQCALVSISRSSFYYEGKGESPLNLALMRLIDAQFLETPWYGSRQMARHLRRLGYTVGRKRVRAADRPACIELSTTKPHKALANDPVPSNHNIVLTIMVKVYDGG